MRGISKSFVGVKANQDVNLKLQGGEILGLLGENGAGKTTLMNILYGLYLPDEGQVLINDQEIRLRNPKDSMQAGIGMIHQHFMLIQKHSVWKTSLWVLTEPPSSSRRNTCENKSRSTPKGSDWKWIRTKKYGNFRQANSRGLRS